MADLAFDVTIDAPVASPKIHPEYKRSVRYTCGCLVTHAWIIGELPKRRIQVRVEEPDTPCSHHGHMPTVPAP